MKRVSLRARRSRIAFSLPLAILLASGAQASSDEFVSGALFFPSEDGTKSVAAPVLDSELWVRVTGIVARTRLRQEFHNPSEQWLEALYAFPLPEGAAVDALELRVGERVLVGEIAEKQEASRRYEAAKSEGRKATLLSQERPNLFTTAVANVAPGERVVVEIEYQQTLTWQAGAVEVRVPLVVSSRYLPGGALDSDSPRSAASDLLPAFLPASFSPMQPPRRSEDAEPPRPWRVHMEIDPGFAVAAMGSPSHPVMGWQREDGLWTVEGLAAANRDLVVLFEAEPDSAPRTAIFSEPADGNGGHHVLMVVLPPSGSEALGEAARGAQIDRELIFVIDTSGSMAGDAIARARDALVLAIDRLRPSDRFNVVAFSSHVTPLFGHSLPATADHVADAFAFVSDLEAEGGTNMAPALVEALTDEGGDELRQVVFLTDGSIGTEAQLFELIETKLGRSRLFTVGIGSAPNSYFLERAARFGRGTYTYVSRSEEVGARMATLFRKLESPVLQDVEVDFHDAVEMWPQAVPDLYAGEPVVVAAFVPRFVGDVRISGRLGEGVYEDRFTLVRGSSHSGIGKLFARRKIASLMETLALGADPISVRESVVEVALAHGLVSRYTALVAVDQTPERPASAPLASRGVPVPRPHGWAAAGTGAGLPRGGTGWLVHSLAGLALCLFAGAARRGRACL